MHLRYKITIRKFYLNQFILIWSNFFFLNILSLEIILYDSINQKFLAEYSLIKINDEQTKYKLEIVDYIKNSSSSGDSLIEPIHHEPSHNGMPFRF